MLLEAAVNSTSHILCGFDLVCCCSGANASSVPEIALSLCGNLDHQDARISDETFNQYLVTHENLCEVPTLLSDPNLVVRVGGKYVNYSLTYYKTEQFVYLHPSVNCDCFESVHSATV